MHCRTSNEKFKPAPKTFWRSEEGPYGDIQPLSIDLNK
jgi:hypothetical protein